MGFLDDLKRKAADLASRVYDQVNVTDNGRTYKQRTPTNDRSTVSQLAHNGTTNVAGDIVKPVVRFPINYANAFGNLGRKAAGIAPQTPQQQFTDPFTRSLTQVTDASGTNRQLFGDAANIALTAFAPGTSRVVEQGVARALPRAGALLPKVVGSGVTGAAVGGPSNVATLVANDRQPVTRDSLLSALASGALAGAGAGAAIPVVGAGARQGAKVAGRAYENRTPLNEVGAVGKNAKEPTISELSSNNRPQADIQTAIEQAHNAGDSAKVAELITQLPPDMQAPMRSALGIVEQPAPTTGKKQRGFITSVKNSPEVSQTLKKKVSGTYEPRNTSALQSNADAFVKKNLNQATSKVNDDLSAPLGTISDQNVAEAIATAKAHDAKGNFDQAQQIYDKLAEHGTKGGQQIQAFSLLSNRTPEGIKFAAQRELKKAGVQLKDADQQNLQDLIDKVSKTKSGTEERARAVHEVQQFVGRKIPSSLGRRLTDFWRAGLLTSPVTTAGNILGNSSEAVTRNLWTNPIATAADALISLGTGKRTKTLAGSQTKGAIEGAKVSADYLKTGFDPKNSLKKYDAAANSEVNYGDSKVGKAISSYVNGVYRLLGAQDKPFRYAAERQATRDLAVADARNLKLQGAERDKYIQSATNDPNWKPQTFKTKNTAQKAGEYAVFANDTLLGKIASGAKRSANQHGGGWAEAVVNFVLPFTQVPASVAMRIIDRTPIGIAREAVSQWARGSFDQRALSEAIGNGTFGPAVIAAGYSLAKAGDITGNYPTDKKEQELWKLEGKQANSVRIGNRWYSLNYIQPFGTLLGIGAQSQKDKVAGASAEEAIANGIATASKSIESQSFLQGVNGVLSAINDPERSANKYVTTTASSVVPNFIRTTARATDPLQRDSQGALQGVQGAIPGLRENLPAKQDAFGRPLQATDNPLNQLFNPGRPSTIKNENDRVVGELRRLQDSQNGIIPTQYNKNVFAGKDGKGTTLSDDQLRQLQSQVGAKVYSEWSQLVRTPEYQSLSDADKATALKRLMDTVAAGEKQKFAASNSVGPYDRLSPTNSSLTADQQRYLDGTLDITKFTKTGKEPTTKTVTPKKTTKAKAASTSSARRVTASSLPKTTDASAAVSAASALNKRISGAKVAGSKSSFTNKVGTASLKMFKKPVAKKIAATKKQLVRSKT